MRFTVAICTFNRCEVLPRAINAALAQTNARDYEVLVVDNNSTDATAQVLAGHSDPDGRIRVVNEINQGLSHARNRAIAEARGEWIAFMDDDAEMQPNYLTVLAAAIERENNPGAIGGPIEVGWLGPVPDWYEPPMDGCFGQVNYASYRMELKYPRILYGSNMVFPVALLRELGGFNPQFGRLGDRQLACEDGEIILRIMTQTRRPVIWEPALRVVHLIQPAGLTVQRMFARVSGGGFSQAILEKMYPGKSQIFGVVLGLVENLLRIILRRPRGVLMEKLNMSYNWNYLKQWLRPLPSGFKPFPRESKLP